MYIAYELYEDNGICLPIFVAAFKTKQEAEYYKQYSNKTLNIEECDIVSLSEKDVVEYIDFKYSNKKEKSFEVKMTNHVESRECINRCSVFGNTVYITQEIETGCDLDSLEEKMITAAQSLLLDVARRKFPTEKGDGFVLDISSVSTKFVDVDNLLSVLTQ